MFVSLQLKQLTTSLQLGQMMLCENFAAQLGEKFVLGTISNGPGDFQFYSVYITQFDDMMCTVHVDGKLSALALQPPSRVRRRNCNDQLNEVQDSAYMQICSSLGWLGITASPLCSFYTSYLQQRFSNPCFSVLMAQANSLCVLQKIETPTKCSQPPSNEKHVLFIFSSLMLVTRTLAVRCVALLVWSLVKLNKVQSFTFFYRPLIRHAVQKTLHLHPKFLQLVKLQQMRFLLIVVQKQSTILTCHWLFWLMLKTSTHLCPFSEPPRINWCVMILNTIRFCYEIEIDLFGWIPGFCNLFDAVTKLKGPLQEALVLTLATCVLHVDLSSIETATRHCSLG